MLYQLSQGIKIMIEQEKEIPTEDLEDEEEEFMFDIDNECDLDEFEE